MNHKIKTHMKRKHIVWRNNVASLTKDCTFKSPNKGEVNISIVAIVAGILSAILSIWINK